jgi:hypothetical protein
VKIHSLLQTAPQPEIILCVCVRVCVCVCMYLFTCTAIYIRHVHSTFLKVENISLIYFRAGPSGGAVQGVGLRPLACLDRGLESHWEHGSLL